MFANTSYPWRKRQSQQGRRRRFLPRLEQLEDRRVPSAVITVNSTADTNDRDEALTLREAILINNRTLAVGSLTLVEQANITGTPTDVDTDTIAFNIEAIGVQTIEPVPALPTITDPVLIDGCTQPGAQPNSLAIGTNAVLLIELSGGELSLNVEDGLRIAANSTTIRGLVINRFPDTAIEVTGHSSVITGNFIGTDPTGSVALGNSMGVNIAGFGYARVGGTDPADRNLICGHEFAGINLTSESTSSVFQGNLIGSSGADLGNTFGICIGWNQGEIWRFNLEGARRKLGAYGVALGQMTPNHDGWTQSGGYGIQIALGSTADGDARNDIVFLRAADSAIWTWAGDQWNFTGGWLTKGLAAGDQQLFGLGYDNEVWRYRVGGGWTPLHLSPHPGAHLVVGSIGDHDPANDILYLQRGNDSSLWSFTAAGGWSFTGNWLSAEIVAGDHQLFGLDLAGQFGRYRVSGWLAAGGTGIDLGVATDGDANPGNDLVFLEAADGRIWLWDQVTLLQTPAV